LRRIFLCSSCVKGVRPETRRRCSGDRPSGCPALLAAVPFGAPLTDAVPAAADAESAAPLAWLLDPVVALFVESLILPFILSAGDALICLSCVAEAAEAALMAMTGSTRTLQTHAQAVCLRGVGRVGACVCGGVVVWRAGEGMLGMEGIQAGMGADSTEGWTGGTCVLMPGWRVAMDGCAEEGLG
jgi:hypothetical protein